MIIVNILRGGLGNQLFQWSVSRKLEMLYDCEVFMDISNLSGHLGITSRGFELSQFPNIKYKILDDVSYQKYTQKPIQELHEGAFNYSHNLTDDKNYSLIGYWQHFNIVEEISKIVKDELNCPDSVENNFYKKYPFLNSKTISLHVRRTDYLTSNGFHPVQPISYYGKALEIIGDYDNILVFSDDIKWCKENLNFKNLNFIEGQTSSEDLWLMSLCKDNIIANSSFSWWGAYLNKNKTNKVVAPNSWFQSGGVPWMLSPEWIVI